MTPIPIIFQWFSEEPKNDQPAGHTKETGTNFRADGDNFILHLRTALPPRKRPERPRSDTKTKQLPSGQRKRSTPQFVIAACKPSSRAPGRHPTQQRSCAGVIIRPRLGPDLSLDREVIGRASAPKLSPVDDRRQAGAQNPRGPRSPRAGRDLGVSTGRN
jgi:hypothetical protein